MRPDSAAILLPALLLSILRLNTLLHFLCPIDSVPGFGFNLCSLMTLPTGVCFPQTSAHFSVVSRGRDQGSLPKPG